MKKKTLLSFLILAVAGVVAQAQVVPQIWQEYVANPNAHPNIPNCSYAGYRYGDVALPAGSSFFTVNVKDVAYGAKGDNATDDTNAIRKAIKAAEDAGGGVVYFPNGNYICSGVLFINGNNVILKGESRTGTILQFTNSLTTGYAPNYSGGSTVDQIMWSWCGGMIWITPKSKNTYLTEPTDNLNAVWLGKNADKVYLAEKELWNVEEELTAITSTDDRGSFSFSVASASGLTSGQYIAIRYKNPSDWSLMKYFTGDGAFADEYNWSSGTAWINSTNRPYVDWVVQIESVTGNKVTLKQPLRLPLRTNWEPKVMKMGDLISESGVENLTLILKKDTESRYGDSNWRNSNHNREKGWNGIYLNNAVNCFVKDVTVYDAETSAGVSACKNITITGIAILGKDKPNSSHHGLCCRMQSQDILFENFEMNDWGQFDHGINVEDFSMGNVWHNGLVIKGCFDTHKLVPAECLRTNIKVQVGGGYGGAGDAGPQIGARFVHWNVEIKGTETSTIVPSSTMPMGALVAISNAKPSSSTASGCRVEATNLNIEQHDLYLAQKQVRNNIIQPTSLLTPWKVWEAPSRIEAEDTKISSVNVASDLSDSGSNVSYLNSFNSEEKKSEYNIKVDESGKYKFTFRVCSDVAGVNRLGIMDKGVEIGSVSFTGTQRGIWSTVDTTVLLNPGIHTIELFGKAGAPCLNWLEISDVVETSAIPFPVFETLPGTYNAMVNVKFAAAEEGTSVYYRIDEKSQSFTAYAGQDIILTETAVITAFSRKGTTMSVQNSARFEVIPPQEIPCRILAIDCSDHFGVAPMNAEPNVQMSVAQEGDWIDFYVTAPEDGYYQINSRITIKTKGQVPSSGFEVWVNDVLEKQFLGLSDMGGNWDVFKIYPVKAYLNSGLNKIRLVAQGKRLNFDWLEVWKTTPVALPGIIETENYDANAEKVGYHRVVSTSSGRESGYEVELTSSTKYYYQVKVDVTGVYPVDFIVSSRASDGKGQLVILKNSEQIAGYSAPQLSSSSLESKITIDATLPKGIYTIGLSQPSGGNHYIEKIIVGQPKSTDPSDPGIGEETVSTVVALDENWVIYPNPVKDYVYMNGLDCAEYQIINNNGIVVMTGKTSNGQPIDVRMLSAGFYHVRIADKTRTIMKI